MVGVVRHGLPDYPGACVWYKNGERLSPSISHVAAKLAARNLHQRGFLITTIVTMVAFTFLALAAAATQAFAAPAAEALADAPDFEIGAHNLARRQMDYNQNYKTGGSVNFSPSSNGYSVTFSGAGDFVVGKGWRKGAERYFGSK